MKKIWGCRRSIISIIAIGCLTGIAVKIGTDIGAIALAISGIVGSVAASNAYQGKKEEDR